MSLRHLPMIRMVPASMFPRSSAMAPLDRRDQAEIFSGCTPREYPHVGAGGVEGMYKSCAGDVVP